MVYLTSSNIEKLERIKSGKFGTVYKKDDNTAYKIYHPTVADNSWKETMNPTLLVPQVHYNFLIKRSQNLKYSGGVIDKLYVDGKFAGVVIPYYDGVELFTLMDEPIDFKIKLSKKIIRNAKELTNNLIYPTDYKLNNILYSNGKVQLIDLDDVKTHVCITPNIIFNSLSINILGETIQTFLKEYKHLPLPKEVKKKLEKENFFYTTKYNKIEEYLKRKEKKKNVIFIYEDTDYEKLKRYISQKNYKIVYVLKDEEKDDKNHLLNIINRLKENNIIIYDFTTFGKKNDYKEIENINEEFEFDNKGLKKVLKK